MSLRDWIYLLLGIIQCVALWAVLAEANECRWNRQSRWITVRIGVVIGGLMVLTGVAGIVIYKNEITDWLLCAGIAAMTGLLVLNLRTVIRGMTDESLAEEIGLVGGENFVETDKGNNTEN